MADITASSVHLPIEIWLANASGVHADVPTIENLADIMEAGYELSPYLDDESHVFAEPKTQVPIPVLTAIGPKVRDVKMLSGAETVELPINAFNYALYAILNGLDPATAIINDAPISLNANLDAVATLLNRVESIDTIRFCLLAQVQPSDPELGDKYILCPKLVINMETITQMLQSQYYKQTISLQSVVLTADELENWQTIFPSIKKTIGMYSFHVDIPVT